MRKSRQRTRNSKNSEMIWRSELRKERRPKQRPKKSVIDCTHWLIRKRRIASS